MKTRIWTHTSKKSEFTHFKNQRKAAEEIKHSLDEEGEIYLIDSEEESHGNRKKVGEYDSHKSLDVKDIKSIFKEKDFDFLQKLTQENIFCSSLNLSKHSQVEAGQ